MTPTLTPTQRGTHTELYVKNAPNYSNGDANHLFDLLKGSVPPELQSAFAFYLYTHDGFEVPYCDPENGPSEDDIPQPFSARLHWKYAYGETRRYERDVNAHMEALRVHDQTVVVKPDRSLNLKPLIPVAYKPCAQHLKVYCPKCFPSD